VGVCSTHDSFVVWSRIVLFWWSRTAVVVLAGLAWGGGVLDAQEFDPAAGAPDSSIGLQVWVEDLDPKSTVEAEPWWRLLVSDGAEWPVELVERCARQALPAVPVAKPGEASGRLIARSGEAEGRPISIGIACEVTDPGAAHPAATPVVTVRLAVF